MKRIIVFLIGIGGLFCVWRLEAQQATYLKEPPISIPKGEGELILDGISDEALWSNACSVPFIVYRPVWGMEPSERTELLVTYDEAYLYVAGRCFTKDINTLVARNLVRDGWRGDDWMTFHVDSRFDRQNALVFSIYPLGSRYDAAVSNDAVDLGTSSFNQDFNMIWEAASIINEEGWFYELKIPLYNLRFKPLAEGKIYMGISAARTLQHHQEVHQFPAVPLDVMDPMSKPSFKQPVVLEGIPKQKLFWLTPYTLLSRSRSMVPQVEEGFKKQINYNKQLGLDAKIGLSSYLTMDISVNPDFAQVEADDQLVNLTRFSLFFPEKRLFFQEAAGLFDFNLGNNTQLFYSRRIGIDQGRLTPIYGGLRLTGKWDERTDIGVLSMQSAPVDDGSGGRRETENFSVVRARTRMFNERSFVGMMFTQRLSRQQSNYALGADAMINPLNNQYILLSAAQTFLQENQKFDYGIQRGRYTLSWENRQSNGWHHRMSYVYSGKDFDPGIGFVDRSNFHQWSGNLNYGSFATNKEDKFQYKRWTLLNFSGFMQPGTQIWETLTLGSSLLLRTFSGVDWTLTSQFQRELLETPLNFGNGVVIEPGIYGFTDFGMAYFPPTFRNVRSTVRLSEGGFFNGRRFQGSINPVFNLGKHWEIRTLYTYTRLRFAEWNLYRDIHLGRLQVNFALDLHLSIAWILQYNSVVDQYFNNFRFRYNFKDGHDLYLVWNENFLSHNRQGLEGLMPEKGDQALILKYNYTFDRLLK
jgi:hypothetical protein